MYTCKVEITSWVYLSICLLYLIFKKWLEIVPSPNNNVPSPNNKYKLSKTNIGNIQYRNARLLNNHVFSYGYKNFPNIYMYLSQSNNSLYITIKSFPAKKKEEISDETSASLGFYCSIKGYNLSIKLDRELLLKT